MLAMNKPPGMTVHPAPGHASSTLVNAILAHCGDLSGIGGVLRPGIVHRLDRDTSGVILVAKNDAAHNALARQLKERTVEKTYVALVEGTPKPAEGTIDAPIARDQRNRQRMAVDRRRARVDDGVQGRRAVQRAYRWWRRGRRRGARTRSACTSPRSAIPSSATACTGRHRSSCGGSSCTQRRIAFAHPRTSERMDLQAASR